MKLPGSKKRKKKTVTCPRCLKPVSADTPFCESCGARIGPPPTCSLCGTLLTPGARFCASCGAMVGSSGERLADPPEAKEQEELSEEKPPARRQPKKKQENRDEPERAPDPLMMIPEDGEDSVAAPLPLEPSKPRAKRPVTVTTLAPPPSATDGIVAALRGRRGVAIGAAVILVCVGIVLLLTGAIHIARIASPVESIPVTSTASGVTAAPGTIIPDTSVPVTILATPTPTPVPTETFSLVPGPTEVPPSRFAISLEADRDEFTRMVSVRFMGGSGQLAVQNIDVRLSRSDGQVLTGSFRPTQAGKGIELQGTDKVDRVEVTVTYVTGESYKEMDKVFDYVKQL